MTPGDGVIVADWNEIEHATHYELQWASAGQQFGVSPRAALPSQTSFAISGLSNGLEQRVRVRAHQLDERSSPWSAILGVTPTADDVPACTADASAYARGPSLPSMPAASRWS